VSRGTKAITLAEYRKTAVPQTVSKLSVRDGVGTSRADLQPENTTQATGKDNRHDTLIASLNVKSRENSAAALLSAELEYRVSN
jgi:hypothetical protein